MGPGTAGTLRSQRAAGLFALQVSRSSFLYRSVAANDSALRLQIREITEPRIHYGYCRVHVMLRREGWRHRGEDHALLAERKSVYEAAKMQNPHRWSGATRNWSRHDEVWLNPERETLAA